MTDLFIYVVLIAVGILFHFLVKLQEMETQGQIVTPWQYWRQHPYTSLVVVMSAYLYFAWRYSEGPMVISDAILIGIACNSLGDKLRARAQKL